MPPPDRHHWHTQVQKQRSGDQLFWLADASEAIFASPQTVNPGWRSMPSEGREGSPHVVHDNMMPQAC